MEEQLKVQQPFKFQFITKQLFPINTFMNDSKRYIFISIDNNGKYKFVTNCRYPHDMFGLFYLGKKAINNTFGDD